MNTLPQLLESRKALTQPLHTIIIGSDEAAMAAKGMLAAAQIRSGVSVFAMPSPTRLNALFSLAAAMVIPASTTADPIRKISDVTSTIFRARASGVPIAEWRPDVPLPRDPLDAASPVKAPRHSILPSGAPAQRLISLRVASQAARYEALSAIVEVDTYQPTVWTEPRATIGKPLAEPNRPQKIVVAGHDMKFAHPAVAELRAQGHEVRFDEWSGHARHDEARSRELLRWGDVVWCEWALGNVAWYSRNVDSLTRLVTRLHLQELSTAFPSTVRWEKVDATIAIADHVRRQLLRDTNAPEDRTVVIPNMVHVPDALPQRHDVARFRLGLVGMVPARKGLREALDLLVALRSIDDRYTLSLRGKRPEEYPWMAERGEESKYFATQLERIETDPRLRGAVEFSPFGPDMAEWYAGVGVVLSTSEFESFHFTAPDGAVNGALPMLLNWAGADLLYPASWLHPNVEHMAAAILKATADAHVWRQRAVAAREFIAENYAEDRVVRSLTNTILGRTE
ncbi:glycosyltransferase family 4 protein [Gulosibacter chungangensis]|uniref:glycosyltransferase family 4 protein n=1 Tax=Gulosibacter chungangensis TaxID=979746 RepID=UPI0013018E3F|nr:glycosyltransferase family 4 protein [Gulosibacter chungangensis]